MSIFMFISLIGGAIWGYNEFKGNHYDENGYNRHGYDREGYDINGYDKSGFDKNGYNQNGYDRRGFDIDGYDVNGYSNTGFNIDGYDREGYDLLGYNHQGYDRALNNRDYYEQQLRFVKDCISNHSNQKVDYSYKMLDCRKALEKMTTSIIKHNIGNEILKDKENQSLCKYLDIINEKKNNWLDLNDFEKKEILLTKRYCNNYLHEEDNEKIDYKDAKVIDTIKMLYSKVCKNLDIRMNS